MTNIPNSQSLLNQTNLLFGLVVQPFTEVPPYEQEIPKVDAKEGILRCERCSSYINMKYQITYSGMNKLVAICNICKKENEININTQGVKTEYLNNDFSHSDEMNFPTVDFIAPENFNQGAKEFKPHYIFMIDISKAAYEIGFPSYILNSIQGNVDNFHNAEGTFVNICFYDQKYIYFFYFEKGEIKLSIVTDISDPFCPISIDKLFVNITQQRGEFEKLLEKVNGFLADKYANLANEEQSTPRNLYQTTITGAAIKAGIDALKPNGGRVMIFTPNPCQNGFGCCIPREKINNKENERIKELFYLPQHELFTPIAEEANLNRTVVDQFVFMNNNYDLATMGQISNLTGGHVFYYPYSLEQNAMNSNYEKMHYDITRIISRPNYYDVKFMIRFTLGLDCSEILGSFNKFLGEAFQLGGCDPDFSYFYNLRMNENFKNDQKIDFQIVCLYNDNFGQRYLRIFNSTYNMTEDIAKIFSTCDVDAMTKAMIMKEITLAHRSDFVTIRKNLEDRIINSFKFYRVKEKSSTPPGQLILPVSVRYLPLYINTLIKRGIFSKNVGKFQQNQLEYTMLKLLRYPLENIIKYLYPKFYRIDNVETASINDIGVGTLNETYNIITKPWLLSLSKDNIDFDCSYLIDDGEFINIFIFDENKPEFYMNLFGVESWQDAVQSEITTLNEENTSELNTRILNIVNQLRGENGGIFQPIRLFLFDQNGVYKNELAGLLFEDKIGEEVNYSDYLCFYHAEIQKRIS